MISSIRGKVIDKGLSYLVIDVNGIGYKTFSPASTLETTTEGAEINLWTYLSVREDALDLYGFADKKELSFFRLLISVSGIGPKSALAILNATTVGTLEKAIVTGDTSHLTKVSGIGKKSAERIVIELRDKIGAINIEGADMKQEVDAVEALKSLGYSREEARDALNKITSGSTKTTDLVKEALKILGNAHN